jgi:hypothetical protein
VPIVQLCSTIISNKRLKQIYIDVNQEHLLKAIAQQAGVSKIKLFAKQLTYI